jgi:hydrogenase maturation protease
MLANRIRCLVLTCGNTLRSDDGVGPYLAEWAENSLRNQPGIRVLCRQQWTPELAEDIAHADAVLFVDSSTESAPGNLQLVMVEPEESKAGIASHHLSAAQLLSLCRELYPSMPNSTFLLTVGMGSTELGNTFSTAVQAALPEAQALLEKTAVRLLQEGR